jgi:hypothetical protein
MMRDESARHRASDCAGIVKAVDLSNGNARTMQVQAK